MANDKYIPGVCNIGPAEIQKRKQLGWKGVVVTVALLLPFISLDISSQIRLIIFIPAFVAAIGFFQAYMHFCADFALKGVLNFSAKAGETDSVTQTEFRKKDRQKAMQIIFYSAIVGLLVVVSTFIFM